MPRYVVSILMLHYAAPGIRRRRARVLAATLLSATVGPPDDVGVFDVSLDADDLTMR